MNLTACLTAMQKAGIHLWSAYLTMDEQRACWCQPIVDENGIVYHRADPGWIMRDHGEHGPVPLIQHEAEEDD